MLKILFASAILALALCGCSKKEDAEMNKFKESAAKAADSAQDAASHAGNAAKDATEDAARSVKETARDVKDAAAAAGEKTKEGAKTTMRNLAEKSKDTPSAAAKDWSDFRALVRKCDALTGEEHKQCMAEAKAMYRASDFQCQTLGSGKMQCLRYAEQWKSAQVDPPKAAITHTEEPRMSPATPGDASAAERNRDSTKQQQDAAGTLPESPKQN